MITKVTVTGADDKTKQEDLIALAKEYPFVEFGILLSPKSVGNKRFPSWDWIFQLEYLRQTNNISKNHFSAHLCGQYVKDLLYANMMHVGVVIHDYYPLFNRFQINTHGIKHGFEETWLPVILKELQKHCEIIFQYDEVNKNILNHVVVRNGSDNISALFDLSHGAGVLPENWPVPLEDIKVGYAGGLSPDNVVEQIEKILPLTGDKDIWIDAETRLRSDVDDTFDLDKVRRFLDVSKPYIK